MQTITVWHNIARTLDDMTYRAGWHGYQVGHPLTPVFEFTFGDVPDLEPMSPEDIAWVLFRRLNVKADPSPAPMDIEASYREYGYRSLAVGDVIQVNDVWLACDWSGWTEIAAPQWVVFENTFTLSPDTYYPLF